MHGDPGTEQLFEGRRVGTIHAPAPTALALVLGLIVGAVIAWLLPGPARQPYLFVGASCSSTELQSVRTTIAFRSAYGSEQLGTADPIVVRAVNVAASWPPARIDGGMGETLGGAGLAAPRDWLRARAGAAARAARVLRDDREVELQVIDAFATMLPGDVRVEVAVFDVDGTVMRSSARARCEGPG